MLSHSSCLISTCSTHGKTATQRASTDGGVVAAVVDSERGVNGGGKDYLAGMADMRDRTRSVGGMPKLRLRLSVFSSKKAPQTGLKRVAKGASEFTFAKPPWQPNEFCPMSTGAYVRQPGSSALAGKTRLYTPSGPSDQPCCGWVK